MHIVLYMAAGADTIVGTVFVVAQKTVDTVDMSVLMDNVTSVACCTVPVDCTAAETYWLEAGMDSWCSECVEL